MFGRLHPTPASRPTPIRALPAVVVEDLYAIFNPASARNPFKTESGRWRNLLIFTLLLRLGLRRGEAAILTEGSLGNQRDLATGKETYWLNVEGTADEDPRFARPGLKTVLARRELPIPRELLAIIYRYTENYRGRTHYPQLLMGQKEAPLSLRSISEVFETVTRHLSSDARNALERQGLETVSCHDLRHTSAVTRMSLYQNAGIDVTHATEKLRMYFGWTPDSEMPRLYAKAYFETTSHEVWTETFDGFVDALRSCVHQEISA
jgi:integrase